MSTMSLLRSTRRGVTCSLQLTLLSLAVPREIKIAVRRLLAEEWTVQLRGASHDRSERLSKHQMDQS